MIKSWKKFNESIHFEETDEFQKIKDKYYIKKEDIRDILDELSDETDFECERIINFIKNISDNSFTLVTKITISKKYKNYKGLNDYQNYLKSQYSDLDWVVKTSQRISQTEETEIIGYGLDKVPFQGTGNNSKEYDELDLKIIFEKEIQSDDINKAYKEFLKKDNPERKAYEQVIKRMIEMGIPENHAKILIEPHPDYEDMDIIMFGFNTNDGINYIATYEKDKKQIFFDNKETLDSLHQYNSGDCSDYL